jgi:hypothetical protein
VTLDALSLARFVISAMYLSAFGPTSVSTLGFSQFDMSLRAQEFILSRLFKPSSILAFTSDVRYFDFHCFSFLEGFHF